jgi:hypothetical protein
VVVVIAIAVGAFLLLRHHGTTPTASNTPPPTSSPRTSPSQQARSAAAQPGAYTLSAPATAAGYTKLAAPPTAVTNIATTAAAALRQHVTGAGGKVTSQVSGYYQLSGGQVMSFVGYQGTFDPAKDLAGSGMKAYPPGSHGGSLLCDASTPTGTVCLWMTPTTFGITEFFSSANTPEVVTNQAKAAQDTVNFRADVEAAKS